MAFINLHRIAAKINARIFNNIQYLLPVRTGTSSNQPEVVEWPDGSKEWYLNGELHREDGPAVEKADGSKRWYKNGELHREDGPAVEKADGYKAWYKNGERHRVDGPAIEYSDGTEDWYLNDKLHREDGPAVEYPDGSVEYCINGRHIYMNKPVNQQLYPKLYNDYLIRQVMNE